MKALNSKPRVVARAGTKPNGKVGQDAVGVRARDATKEADKQLGSHQESRRDAAQAKNCLSPPSVLHEVKDILRSLKKTAPSKSGEQVGAFSTMEIGVVRQENIRSSGGTAAGGRIGKQENRFGEDEAANENGLFPRNGVKAVPVASRKGPGVGQERKTTKKDAFEVPGSRYWDEQRTEDLMKRAEQAGVMNVSSLDYSSMEQSCLMRSAWRWCCLVNGKDEGLKATTLPMCGPNSVHEDWEQRSHRRLVDADLPKGCSIGLPGKPDDWNLQFKPGPLTALGFPAEAEEVWYGRPFEMRAMETLILQSLRVSALQSVAVEELFKKIHEHFHGSEEYVAIERSMQDFGDLTALQCNRSAMAASTICNFLRRSITAAAHMPSTLAKDYVSRPFSAYLFEGEPDHRGPFPPKEEGVDGGRSSSLSRRSRSGSLSRRGYRSRSPNGRRRRSRSVHGSRRSSRSAASDRSRSRSASWGNRRKRRRRSRSRDSRSPSYENRKKRRSHSRNRRSRRSNSPSGRKSRRSHYHSGHGGLDRSYSRGSPEYRSRRKDHRRWHSRPSSDYENDSDYEYKYVERRIDRQEEVSSGRKRERGGSENSDHRSVPVTRCRMSNNNVDPEGEPPTVVKNLTKKEVHGNGVHGRKGLQVGLLHEDKQPATTSTPDERPGAVNRPGDRKGALGGERLLDHPETPSHGRDECVGREYDHGGSREAEPIPSLSVSGEEELVDLKTLLTKVREESRKYDEVHDYAVRPKTPCVDNEGPEGPGGTSMYEQLHRLVQLEKK